MSLKAVSRVLVIECYGLMEDYCYTPGINVGVGVDYNRNRLQSITFFA